MKKSLLLLILLLPQLHAEDMLVTLSQTPFAGGMDRVWTSVNVTTSSGKDQLHAKSVARTPLLNSDTAQETGIWMEIHAPKPGRFMVARQDAEMVPEDLFKKLRLDWFDARMGAQRETVSLKPKSGEWRIVVGGLNKKDRVRVEWVFARMGEGNREITVRGPEGGLLLKADLGEEDGARHVESGPLSGSETYTFTFSPTGTEWACLPNAFRVVREAQDELP